jgi:hypothetical protein
MNRKRFGVWAECAVARAFRDRHFTVLTAEALNLIPYRDLIVETGERQYDIQVKGTAPRRHSDFYRGHWSQLRKYVNAGLERDRRWILAVADLSRKGIYLFRDAYVRKCCEQAEADNGSRASFPGLLRLEYECASSVWGLTMSEIAEGQRLVDDDDDAGQDDLFGT